MKTFVDNCNFKYNFQENDEIELNIRNKLFVVTGKKYNQLFYYDFDKNEMSNLAELKYSHYFGSLIYVPLNNSIYCIGGVNSVKCEIYRNDEIIPPIACNNESKLASKWKSLADLNITRQEFSTIIFNNFLYAFFGFNNEANANNNTVERLNVSLNDKWELITFANPYNISISLSSQGCLKYSDVEILLLGGFDGKNYRDGIISFNIFTNTFAPTKFKIPDHKKNNFYHFFKESNFIEFFEANEGGEINLLHALFDSKEKLHLINTKNFKYEIVQT
jgi:N-acetylneuraminic acid mutarotase